MSIEWNIKKLGQVAKTYSGGTPDRGKDAYWNGEIPWLKSGELNDRNVFLAQEKITEEGLRKSSTKFVEENTLLIAMYGATAGKVGLAKSKFAINQAICAVVPNKEIITEFYLYYFISIREDLLSKRFGGAQPNLNQQIIKNLEIPVPPPAEQLKIAKILSTIQEAKEKTEEVIRATKELKKSMMKHLFTYGPVPSADAEKVKLREAEVGMMPEEWETVRLGEVITGTQYGLSLRGEQKGQYPILRMNNLTDGRVDTSELQYVNLDKRTEERFKLNKGDILFNRTNSIDLVGKTSIFELENEFVFASYLIRVITNISKLEPQFLNYYLNWNCNQGRLKMLASRGVSQSNINATKLRGFALSLPPLNIQQRIVHILLSIDAAMAAEENKKKALEGLFKTLLNDLITVKIRVNNLEV